MDIKRDGESERKFWQVKSGKGYYTVMYCPRCKKQMTWHTIAFNIWKCDMCSLLLTHDKKRGWIFASERNH